jgi:hypothetical protein
MVDSKQEHLAGHYYGEEEGGRSRSKSNSSGYVRPKSIRRKRSTGSPLDRDEQESLISSVSTHQQRQVMQAKPAAGYRSMDTVWVSGTLKALRTDSYMGSSGYRMEATAVEPYTEKR